jgi:hypothetical protein
MERAVPGDGGAIGCGRVALSANQRQTAAFDQLMDVKKALI